MSDMQTTIQRQVTNMSYKLEPALSLKLGHIFFFFLSVVIHDLDDTKLKDLDLTSSVSRRVSKSGRSLVFSTSQRVFPL